MQTFAKQPGLEALPQLVSFSSGNIGVSGHALATISIIQLLLPILFAFSHYNCRIHNAMVPYLFARFVS